MKLFLSIILLFLSLTIKAQKADFHHINFEKADSIAKTFKGFSLRNIPILAYNLTQNLDTKAEQFRAIYTWVCFNIESDHSFGEITLRKRRKFKNDSLSFLSWNNDVRLKMFQRLLKDKKTICSGYAYLIKELSKLAGLDCEVVDGYSRTTKRNVGEIDIPNHSWNAVKLNNKWYLVDATLASGYFNIDENKFIKNYNDGYFLAEPDLFIKRNYPIDPKWILLENKPTLKQFVEAPIIYGNTFKHDIISVAPKTLRTKVFINDDVLFKFKIPDETKTDQMRFIVNNGLRSETITLSCSDYKNGFVELKHRFTRKGYYNVHLMVNTDFVVSYTIKVEKLKKTII